MAEQSRQGDFVNEELTGLQKVLIEQFWPQARTKDEKDILVILGLGARESEIEEEILDFICENPQITIMELGDKFTLPQVPLEIVDDEYLDEDS